MLVCVVAGVLLFYHRPCNPASLPDAKSRYRACVIDAKENATGLSMLAKVGETRVRLTTPSIIPMVEPGDVVSFTGQWSGPLRDVDLPMEDNGLASARRDGIDFRCFVAHDSLRVEGHESNLRSVMWRCRRSVTEAIVSSSLDESAAQFLVAVLTGDDDMVDADMRERFSTAGVAHVLALSGAHVAVLATIIAMLLFPLTLLGLRRWRWGVTIIALWAFALMTGMSASVVRSVTMATVVLVGLILERPRSGVNAWCLAGIVILLCDPAQLWQPGFQLSFTATLAIILAVPLLAALPLRGWLRSVVMFVGVTVIATVATAPLVLWHFHRFPLLFIVGNAAVVALMPAMLLCGVILVACELIGVESGWIADVINVVYSVIDWVVDGVSSVGWGSVDAVYLSPWGFAAMMVGVASGFIGMARRRLAFGVAGVMLLLFGLVLSALASEDYADEELYVTRNRQSTQLVYRRGPNVTVVRLSPHVPDEGDSLEVALRYRDWIASRGVMTLKVTDRYADLADSLGVIDVNGCRLMIVGDDWVLRVYPPVDYLLVTRSFRDDIVDLARVAQADTIVLSTDINSRRARRMLEELQRDSIASRLLADAPIAL